jgi:hypothetical protein
MQLSVTEVPMYSLLHPVLARDEALRLAMQTSRPVSIRAADGADASALERLAALDTAPVAAIELAEQAHAGDILVAESGGRILAALRLSDGLAVADPFVRTASLVRMLRVRAAQIARERPRRRRLGLPVLRPRLP